MRSLHITVLPFPPPLTIFLAAPPSCPDVVIFIVFSAGGLNGAALALRSTSCVVGGAEQPVIHDLGLRVDCGVEFRVDCGLGFRVLGCCSMEVGMQG